MALDAGVLEEFNLLHQNAGREMQACLDAMYFDESLCTYCLQGAPDCTKGPCSEVMAPFIEVFSHEGSSFHSADFDNLIVVHNTTTYRFSNFMTTLFTWDARPL